MKSARNKQAKSVLVLTCLSATSRPFSVEGACLVVAQWDLLLFLQLKVFLTLLIVTLKTFGFTDQ